MVVSRRHRDWNGGRHVLLGDWRQRRRSPEMRITGTWQVYHAIEDAPKLSERLPEPESNEWWVVDKDGGRKLHAWMPRRRRKH